MNLSIRGTDYEINKWKPQKTGFRSLKFTRLISVGIEGGTSTKVVREFSIPKFTKYYARYVSNMRTPTPVLELLTEDEYKAQWVKQALLVAENFSLKTDPGIENTSHDSLYLFDKYGTKGVEPQHAFDLEFGTRKANWLTEVTRLLSNTHNTPEYQSVGQKLGSDDSEIATYLYSRYKDSTPTDAFRNFFGIIKQINQSQLTKGVVLHIDMPEYIKSKLSVSSVDITSASEFVTYKNNTIRVQYRDEDHALFPILEEWYKLSRTEGLPESIYVSQCLITGFNNVTHLEESRTVPNIYPLSVGKNLLELRYLPVK